jgi:predicted 2-oxoglutarate/Fe(II)-dependent dioxygenase YbiX
LISPTIFAEKIFYYENVITDPENLVRLLESSDANITSEDAITEWVDWVASGDGEKYVFGKKKHTDKSKLNSSSDDIKKIYETLTKSLADCGKHYCELLNIEYINPAPISISRYEKGASMGPHVDWYGEESIQPLMSAVLYLNDDYEGGELDFPSFGVTIKPKAGSIVIFPSVPPYYHQSLIVKSGLKYMSPAFWVKKLP